MPSNLVVITAFSDTSDNQPWGFKYISPKFVEEVCWFNHLSFVPFKPPPVGFAAANGGSQQKLSFVDCRRFETRHSSQKVGTKSMGSVKIHENHQGWEILWFVDTKGCFLEGCFLMPNCSDCQKTHVELGTLNLPTSLHDGGTYGCSWPGADVVHLLQKWSRKVWVKTSKCPHISAGVLPSKQIDKFSTTIWGRISLLSFLVVVQLISFK